MLKLYYSPKVCSIAPHIALHEGGFEFELVRVDLASKRLRDGTDYRAINSKGYVPALQLDNGEIISEAAVIMQYVADLKPATKLAPPAGTFARVRLQEWLNFIAMELHKGVAPLYSKLANPEYKAYVFERVNARFGVLGKAVETSPFLMGETFTVADGYAFYVLRVWRDALKYELAATPGLAPYYERIAKRPAVLAALEAEGLTV